jgi:hypothetical protein
MGGDRWRGSSPDRQEAPDEHDRAACVSARQDDPAQLAEASFLARYSGHTHKLYASQFRRWFTWCETNALDPLVGIQRAHVALYIRHLSDSGLMAS